MARRIGDYNLSSLGEQDLAPFAFIGSVILGALGIFVSKYFGWPTWLVVAVPLSVMAAHYRELGLPYWQRDKTRVAIMYITSGFC